MLESDPVKYFFHLVCSVFDEIVPDLVLWFSAERRFLYPSNHDRETNMVF